jgi:hypothetical protein
LNCCKIVSIKRPSKEDYIQIASQSQFSQIINRKEENDPHTNFIQRITQLNKISTNTDKLNEIMENIEPEHIMNGKEMRSFSLLSKKEDIPNDIFNIICNNLIKEMENPDKIVFTNFRDIIYDILIYNLDATECIWYILTHFIKKNTLSQTSVSDILIKTYPFLKYYNNNYRPIYHLESILFYIINKLYNLE